MNKIKYLHSFHLRRALLLGSAAIPALAWVGALRAQQPVKVIRIGFLGVRSQSTPVNPDIYYDAFVQGMRELGYIEGKNLVIEWRFADGQAGNLPGLAAELVRMRVDIIVTHSNGTFAAQRATSSIPIVFATASDPVLSGFAASLARPAGNITGLSDISLDLSPKRLDLLKTMIPTLTSAIVLLNPGNPAHASVLKSIQAAGQKLKIRITPLEAGTQDEIERGFAALKSQGNTAIFVASDGFLLGQGRRIADLAVKHRMPSMFHNREGVIAGGLMSYGQNLTDFFHRAAAYAGKIIKGAKPGDLPIEQPMRFELAVNLKTAKALGLKVPPVIMVQATKVIE